MINFTGTSAVVYYLTELSNALSQGNDITIIIPEQAEFENLDPDVSLVKFSFPSGLFRSMLKVFDFSLYKRLTKEINYVNPDIIHITHELRFPFFFAWLVHRNYPVVVTIHEPKPFSLGLIRKILIDKIQLINGKLIAKVSDKVIVHGEQHKRYILQQNIPSGKIEVIPHGEFSFFARYSKGVTKTIQNNILFFGRITSYKGIEYLIQAGKLIEEHIPDVTITIAGEGDFAKYKTLIEGNDRFILCNRFIQDEEVAEFFQKASLVVLPYIDGSQSGIISIAYAFRKPVVATDVGNFSEMVENGETGFIVPPKDSDALAKAIIKLLKDVDLRAKMGENGYRLMRERMQWDKIAEKTLATYVEAVKLWREKNK